MKKMIEEAHDFMIALAAIAMDRQPTDPDAYIIGWLESAIENLPDNPANQAWFKRELERLSAVA